MFTALILSLFSQPVVVQQQVVVQVRQPDVIYYPHALQPPIQLVRKQYPAIIKVYDPKADIFLYYYQPAQYYGAPFIRYFP